MHFFRNRAKTQARTPESIALLDEGLFTPIASPSPAYGGRICSCSSCSQVECAAGSQIRCRDFQFARSSLAAQPKRPAHKRTQFASGAAVALFGLEVIACRAPALGMQARNSVQRAGSFPRRSKRRCQVEDQRPALSIYFELGGGLR